MIWIFVKYILTIVLFCGFPKFHQIKYYCKIISINSTSELRFTLLYKRIMDNSTTNFNGVVLPNQGLISKMKNSLSVEKSHIEAAWKRLEHKLDTELKVCFFILIGFQTLDSFSTSLNMQLYIKRPFSFLSLGYSRER